MGGTSAGGVATIGAALVAGALGLLLWPPARSIRLPAVGVRPPGRRWPRPGVWSLAAAAGLLAGLLTGPLVAAATGAAVATAMHLVAMARRDRAIAAEWRGLLTALRMVVRELRSGASPVAAASSTAQVVPGGPGTLLAGLAVAARTGTTHALAASDGPCGQVADRLREGLQLSVRHGVPLATVVAAICVDVEHRVDAQALRAAQVAGPRFSGYVLAALPAFGLLLGAGMGADPLGVLLGPAPGGLLLPAGTALVCAGLLWSARITRS